MGEIFPKETSNRVPESHTRGTSRGEEHYNRGNRKGINDQTELSPGRNT